MLPPLCLHATADVRRDVTLALVLLLLLFVLVLVLLPLIFWRVANDLKCTAPPAVPDGLLIYIMNWFCAASSLSSILGSSPPLGLLLFHSPPSLLSDTDIFF